MTEPGDDEKIVLVFDKDLMQPACVLLQAAFGYGSNNRLLSDLFDSRNWLVAPTPGMRPMRGTLGQWRKIAEQINKS